MTQSWPGNYRKRQIKIRFQSTNFVASTSTYAIQQNECFAVNPHNFSKHKPNYIKVSRNCNPEFSQIYVTPMTSLLFWFDTTICAATAFFEGGSSKISPQRVIPTSPMHLGIGTLWRNKKQTMHDLTLTWRTKYPSIVYRPGGMREAFE